MSTPGKEGGGGDESLDNKDDVVAATERPDGSSLNDTRESADYERVQQSGKRNEIDMDASTISAGSSINALKEEIEEEEEGVTYEGEGGDEFNEGDGGGDNQTEEEETSNHRGFVPGSADDVMHEESSDSNSSLYERETLFDLRDHKRALKGFTDEDQNRLFPMVDEQSQALFELVQELEDEQFKSSERALLEAKVPVAIPSHHLAYNEGGPEIKLRVVDDATLEPEVQEDEEENDSELLPPGPRKRKGLGSPIVTNVTDVPDKILAALPTDLFSREKKQLLMKTFELGWKREIVMRSNCHPGKKMGDVYYFSPDGTKFRSSKQVALYLAKKPQYGLTVDHFSFAKARVSFDPNQETVRQAYSGKGPIPSPSKGVDTPTSKNIDVDLNDSALVDSQPEEVETPPPAAATVTPVPVRASSSRRSIQPPKRYATGDTVLFNEKKPKLAANTKTVNSSIEMKEGGMEMGMLPPKYPRDMEESKVSAAAGSGNAGQSGSGDYSSARRGRPPKLGGKKIILQKRSAERVLGGNESHNSADDEDGPMFGISALTRTSYRSSFVDQTGGYRGYEAEPSVEVADDGEVRDQNEDGLQPCSIRCPGMSGDIPTLQCRRCLCLYHPQCLGLPNQNYKNFFCANCEDDDGPGVSQQQHRQEHRFVQSRNNVHHNLPQQHHRQQQMRGDQRIRLMRGGGAGGGGAYGKRPPPSLIRMQGRPPQPSQHHIMGQQHQPQMSTQMRGMDPRKMMPMKGPAGAARGSGLQMTGGRGGGLRHPMRLELPKLNLRPILNRASMMGGAGSPEMGGLTRGIGMGSSGRGRGRPLRGGVGGGGGGGGGPRPGAAPMNLPQFLKNNRINAGGAVTITPIGGPHSAAQGTYRRMGSGPGGAGGSSGQMPVPKLPPMRPMRTPGSGMIVDGSRMPNQRMMRGGMMPRGGGRGAHGMVAAAPYRMLKPKMPFTEPEGDESLQQIQISMGGGPSPKMRPQQPRVAQRHGVIGVRGFLQGVVRINDKRYIALQQPEPIKASLLKKVVSSEVINNNVSTNKEGQEEDEIDIVIQEDEVSLNEDIKHPSTTDTNTTEIDQENFDTAEGEENESMKDEIDLSVQNVNSDEVKDDEGVDFEAVSEGDGSKDDSLNINSVVDQENMSADNPDETEVLESKPLERSEIKAL